jgi:hypothetical protein
MFINTNIPKHQVYIYLANFTHTKCLIIRSDSIQPIVLNIMDVIWGTAWECHTKYLKWVDIQRLITYFLYLFMLVLINTTSLFTTEKYTKVITYQLYINTYNLLVPYLICFLWFFRNLKILILLSLWFNYQQSS